MQRQYPVSSTRDVRDLAGNAEQAEQSDMTPRHRWLLLMHQLPPQPDYFRVKVWRRLRAIGAATVKNSVYLLPNTPEAREDFEWLIREIIAGGGEAILCEASFLAGMTDDEVGELLQQRGQGRDRDRNPDATLTPLETSEVTPRRRPSIKTNTNTNTPHGAVWVTRRNIHVDRIASAWLIWRFIDRAARFKFVDGADYKHERGELRFDMFEAEYTHVGAACTFEVLLDTFGLTSDAGLSAIADIVHDIDYKEETFGHAETADMACALDELYSVYTSDYERLEHGAVLFENLYGVLKEERRDY